MDVPRPLEIWFGVHLKKLMRGKGIRPADGTFENEKERKKNAVDANAEANRQFAVGDRRMTPGLCRNYYFGALPAASLVPGGRPDLPYAF